MSRRGRVSTNRHVDGSRDSIGQGTVDAAVSRINLHMHTEIAMYVDQGFTAMDTMHMLFRDDLAAKLSAVAHAVHPRSWVGTYHLNDNIFLGTDWTKTGIPTPSAEVMDRHHDRMDQLFSAMETIRITRLKYGKVVYLLRWLNANATPGAVRNYWPSVLALTAGSSFATDNADAPDRYSAPRNIGSMLELLRETAGTVAGMQLIPSTMEPRDRDEVWLTYPGTSITTEAGLVVPLDATTVSL
jgi:hypothetical protein